MIIKRETLEAAASAGMLKYQQIDTLLVFLVQHELKTCRESEAGRFNAALLFYLGGMLVLSGALLFGFMAVNALGIGALLWFSVLYALCATGVASWCAKRRLQMVGSLFALMAIMLVGAAAFAALVMQGSWAGGIDALLTGQATLQPDGRWLVIELAALAASIGLLLWLRLPFLVLPSACIAWLIGIDVVAPMLLQLDTAFGMGLASPVNELRLVLTLVAGLMMIMLGLSVDLQRRPVDEGLALWSYCAGLLGFCVALSLLTGDDLAGKTVFLVLHAGLVAIGLVLGRRIFQVFGAAGIALVLGQAGWTMFRHSEAFVPALTVLSLVLLACGVWWWHRQRAFSVRLRGMLPQDVRGAPDVRPA